MSSINDHYFTQLNANQAKFKVAFEARQAARAAEAASSAAESSLRGTIYQLLLLALIFFWTYKWLQRRVLRKDYEEMMRLQPPMYEVQPELWPLWPCDRNDSWYLSLRGWFLSIDISLPAMTTTRLENGIESAKRTWSDIESDVRRKYEALRFNSVTDTLLYEYQELANWIGRNKQLFVVCLFVIWYVSSMVERENDRGSVIYVDWVLVSEKNDGFTVPSMFWRHRARHLMLDGGSVD